MLREFCLRTFKCGKLIAIDSWTGVWLLHFILGALHQRVRSTINLACHGATGMQTKTKNYEGREPPLTDRKVFRVALVLFLSASAGGGGFYRQGGTARGPGQAGRHASRFEGFASSVFRRRGATCTSTSRLLLAHLRKTAIGELAVWCYISHTALVLGLYAQEAAHTHTQPWEQHETRASTSPVTCP